MTVENDELENALPLQRTNEITQQRSLRARIHVQAQLNVELPRVHAEWNGGKHHDSRATFPRDPRGSGGNRIALDDIGGVRQVKLCASVAPHGRTAS